MENNIELWYVVLTDETLNRLNLRHLILKGQTEIYGIKYHSHYKDVLVNELNRYSTWLFLVTDTKKLMLASIKYGIDFFKVYEK